MANLEELEEFLSNYTAEQINGAIENYYRKVVLTFNNRRGPEVVPEFGDYTANKIELSPKLPRVSDPTLQCNNVHALLEDIVNSFKAPTKPVLLYGEPGNSSTFFTSGVLALPSPYKWSDFDYLCFICCTDGRQRSVVNAVYTGYYGEPAHNIVPSWMMEDYRQNKNVMLLTSYDTRYIQIIVPSESSLNVVGRNSYGINQLYGCYWNSKLLTEEPEEEGE